MGLDLTKDILGVTEFRSSMSESIERIEKERRPLVLTKGGRPSVVVLDVETYQSFLNALQRQDEQELREGLQRAEEDLATGRTKSHSEAMDEFRKKRRAHKKR